MRWYTSIAFALVWGALWFALIDGMSGHRALAIGFGVLGFAAMLVCTYFPRGRD